ncbi:MAG TPA: NAD-dependent epimerase/dehydratase family protein [Candidatus Dormibacteraeota bacterium]|nr:NAD-dependent epimerase/dehydratase family protein [Candidatus Dormibacteraeota bacterium]
MKTCVVTGANGFVGGRVKNYLQRAGWHVREWTRSPKPGSDAVAFQLGQEVSAEQFRGIDALVHCAYDFYARGWEQIYRVNVQGTGNVLRAAQAAGVPRVVFISSISAFAGCRSLYGKAKMESEAVALSLGQLVIRPGLVYGPEPGGVFGRIANQVKNSRVVPIIAGGAQTQYLVHEEDLANVIVRYLNGDLGSIKEPLTVANDEGLELKQIMRELARAYRKSLTFVPVPWQAVWLVLRTGEAAGLKLNFRSDSLIGMVYQNRNPSFALLKSLGLSCRPFAFAGV